MTEKDYKVLDLPNLTKEELVDIVSYLTQQLVMIRGDRDILKKFHEDGEKKLMQLWSDYHSVVRKNSELEDTISSLIKKDKLKKS